MVPHPSDTYHKALSNETRREIILSLAEEEKYLSQIAEEIGKKPQTIDFHLDKLVDIGVVESEVRGGKKYYFLTDEKIVEFVREDKPVPPHAQHKPPHELVMEMWDEMEKRLDRMERKIDELSDKVEKR